MTDKELLELYSDELISAFGQTTVTGLSALLGGSTGVLYVVSSDTTLTYDGLTVIYRKRWNVEPYHKSLKQNAALERSPTQTVPTQTNHFFAALCGYNKLELLKQQTKLNHFALSAKLYTHALRVAFDTLAE